MGDIFENVRVPDASKEESVGITDDALNAVHANAQNLVDSNVSMLAKRKERDPEVSGQQFNQYKELVDKLHAQEAASVDSPDFEKALTKAHADMQELSKQLNVAYELGLPADRVVHSIKAEGSGPTGRFIVEYTTGGTEATLKLNADGTRQTMRLQSQPLAIRLDK